MAHYSAGVWEWCTGCAGDFHLCRIWLFTCFMSRLKPHLCKEAALKMRKRPSGYWTGWECDCREANHCSASMLEEDSWSSSAFLYFCSDPAQPSRRLVFQKSITPLKPCFSTESIGRETQVFTDLASYCPNLISVNTLLPTISLDATYVVLRDVMWKFT